MWLFAELFSNFPGHQLSEILILRTYIRIGFTPARKRWEAYFIERGSRYIHLRD